MRNAPTLSVEQKLATLVHETASKHQDDVMALLSLLRILEGLHRELQETFFQDVLPQNRQALYSLLREIESQGGWPYIPRISLHEFLERAGVSLMEVVDASQRPASQPENSDVKTAE